MQNKRLLVVIFGGVLIFGVLFYLSFAIISHYKNRGVGMNVIMEISVPDILQTLAGENCKNEMFVNAISEAKEKQMANQKDFVDLFEESFLELYPDAKLAYIFSTVELKDKITPNSTNAEVARVLKGEVKAAVDNSFNVLRSRIDHFGVTQLNMRPLDVPRRILIEMRGVKEPERLRKLLQETAELEFWETMNISEIYSSLVAVNDMAKEFEEIRRKQEVQKPDYSESNKAAVVADSLEASVSELDELLAKIAEQDLIAAEKDSEFIKNNPLFAIMHINVNYQGEPASRPLIGTVHVNDTAKVSQYFKMAKEKRILPVSLVPKWSSKAVDKDKKYVELIAVHSRRDGKAPLTGSVIIDAHADFGRNSAFVNVSIQMNQEGARIWARMTRENIGKSIAIVLDGYVYSYPRVAGEIQGGCSEITGNFTPAEAQDLAVILNSGKMPAPARIVQEEIIVP